MRKTTFLAAFFMATFGLMAQNNFTVQEPVQGPSAIEVLLQRVEAIGKTNKSVDAYFTKAEQRMLNVHFNGLRNLAPVTISQTNTQNIEAGQGIACANTERFTDNSLYRVFDLVGEFGLTEGLQVESVQFGFDEGVTTPNGFPVIVKVYSIDQASDFPAQYQNMTLEGMSDYDATNADSMTVVDVPTNATIPAGKAMVVELQLINDGTDTNYMRFGTNFDGETAPAYIMAEECGAFTPTSFANLGLTNNLILSVLGDSEGGSTGGESMIFGVENSSEQLVSFEMDNTALNPIGNSGAFDFENAGGVDPNDQNTAYVLDSPGNLFKVDLTTGAYTRLGTISPTGMQTWTGAEFDPTTGDFYAVMGDLNGSASLYKIDIDNLDKELIGTNSVDGVISLMINGRGEGYVHDIASDSFYGIDLNTGQTTFIGSLGFTVNYGQGGTWVPGDDDHVYLSAFNNDSFQAEWRQVNVHTGASTMIAPIMLNGDLAQVGWSSATGVTLAVAENTLEGFSFYPNPAKDRITLKAENTIDNVRLYNVIGKLVLDVEVGAKEAQFDVSNLGAGIYMMKVQSNGQTASYKIIRN